MAAPTLAQAIATAIQTGGAAGVTLTCTLAAPPTADNLLVLALHGCAGAVGFDPAANMVLVDAGWNLLIDDVTSNASRARLYWKLARGALDQSVSVRNDTGDVLTLLVHLAEFAGMGSGAAVDTAAVENKEQPNAGFGAGPTTSYTAAGPRVLIGTCAVANDQAVGGFYSGTYTGGPQISSPGVFGRSSFFAYRLIDAAVAGSDAENYGNTAVRNTISYGVAFKAGARTPGIPDGLGGTW